MYELTPSTVETTGRKISSKLHGKDKHHLVLKKVRAGVEKDCGHVAAGIMAKVGGCAGEEDILD